MSTQRQDATELQQLCVDRGIESFESEHILQPQVLPSLADEDRPTICDHTAPAFQQPLAFDSGLPGLDCTASQHFGLENIENSALTSVCCDTTIGPAIVESPIFRDLERAPTSEETSNDEAKSRSSGKAIRDRDKRLNSKSTMKARRQSSKGDRRTRAKDSARMSFPILRGYFCSLPVEEQLQFLSWLFQGALSQCLHRSTNSHDASSLGFVAGDADFSTASVQSLPDANAVDAEPSRTSRKGLPFSAEEDRLLVKLRKEENLAWSEVVTRFSQKFPGRSKGSIQVHWSTRLKNPTAVLN
ncbi:hypothetical protein N7478_010014 [Penicillium angulare]|uniref:uncharacterized protein n=1 Tax=Penicillium angulare TaxID=116970 RepID=UPI0025405406|nr:uncharacterized protein N7478_010014 [Penicillium angulare]KAJ5267206.1 hypothetical protein N7478_010014 [Penicillium angulare]